MNEILKKKKEIYIRRNFKKNIYISQEEYEQIKEDSSIISRYDEEKKSYYKVLFIYPTDEELDTFLQIEIAESLEQLSKNNNNLEDISGKLGEVKSEIKSWAFLWIIGTIVLIGLLLMRQ